VSDGMRYLPSARETATMDSAALRSHFLVQDVFRQGAIALVHVDLDRVVLGGAVPTRAALKLESLPTLKAEYFLERREAGILNVGGAGTIRVDGAAFAMANRDVLYVGRGVRDVTLESADPAAPAHYYIVSYPAHVACPTAHMSRASAEVVQLGDAAHANRRRIVKYIHAGGLRSAQLVLGVTELEQGSVWNTMPPHTHLRRTEVYLYFDLAPDSAVFHFLGEPEAVRTVLARNHEIALSPGWSIHSGCGTSNYSFCWAMGGENQDYADMSPVAVDSLR
jgi:4-deoxy-L-threo-5-hexosulose-uronate ketol-isomerase